MKAGRIIKEQMCGVVGLIFIGLTVGLISSCGEGGETDPPGATAMATLTSTPSPSPTDVPSPSPTVTTETATEGSPTPSVSSSPGTPSPTLPTDDDQDGVPAVADCDDSNPLVYPEAVETCDGQDEDCDGEIDEGLISIHSYRDADGDSYGNGAEVLDSCTRPGGWVANRRDCDDGNADVYPGAPEICNAADEDCDTLVDEGVGPIFYPDSDGDGWGNGEQPQASCFLPPFHVENGGDCDDNQSETYPGAEEQCSGQDEDCDGDIDEGLDIIFYPDEDGDGFGKEDSPLFGCSLPPDHVLQGGDCDDTNPNTAPTETETCNGVDDNCDGATDEGLLNTYFPDDDGDTFGSVTGAIEACEQPANYVAITGDCEDGDPDIFPTSVEVCNDLDDDCNGLIDEGLTSTYYPDEDGDTFGDVTGSIEACEKPPNYVAITGDCEDGDPDISPNGIEVCNGLDDDCSGDADEGLGTTYYPDEDGDGYGSSSAEVTACSPPSGYLSNNQDCNDANAAIKPGAIEDCSDSVDQDCSGDTENGEDATCVIGGYAFGGIPDCASYCYFDEPHNVAINGEGQESNNNGYNRYAPGQLSDGIRGVDAWSADLGNGPAYEWVAWSSQDPVIYMRFHGERTIDAITIGVNNLGVGGVEMPKEIQVFLAHGHNEPVYDVVVFRKDLGTLPTVNSGGRGDIVLDMGGRSAGQIKIYCFRESGWTFIDEIEVR